MIEICDPDFEFIRQLVYDHSRINLGNEKQRMVYARLNKRLMKLGLATVSDYCELLRTTRVREELPHLIDTLSTNFTTFFRELEHFKFMKDVVVPEFFASERGGTRNGPFQAWSAACSTGEEPYSIAITLAACFQAIGRDMWEIFATDISTRVLETARRGVYEASRIVLPNPAWLSRYFQKGTDKCEGYFRIKKRVRNQIDFEHMNLLDPNPGQRKQFHLIFCRNVMIYFDQKTTQHLVEKLTRQLRPEGYLIIGHAESLNWKPSGLEQIKTSIYRKISH